MFETDDIEFAIGAADRTDIFLRQQDEGNARTRYRCVASIAGPAASGAISLHEAAPGRTEAHLRALAETMRQDAILSARLALGDTESYPDTSGGDPVRIFLYLDFLRARLVADRAAARLVAEFSRDGAAALPDPATLPARIAPLYDFNLLARACALAEGLLPRLELALTATPNPGKALDPLGYAMRMLGDLLMRAGDPAASLRAHATGCRAGDNPFRRRKAIEAALAANDRAALADHLAAYREKWPLPDDLAAHDLERAP